MKEFRRRLRLWLCDKMGWHKPAYVYFGNMDSFQGYAECRYCGYHGMIDSQGNLF